MSGYLKVALLIGLAQASNLARSANDDPHVKAGQSGNCDLQISSDTLDYSRAAFERLKMFEGKWVGRSTKGWQDTVVYKVIAQGSVVQENSFESNPKASMVTMYYLDGNRLLLTHYCVSKTQPRLQATVFENNGRRVTFTFLDGTSMPSRDTGHMDKVRFNFVDVRSFTTQWTWYQKGNERWLEEIRYERIK
jgi:hypothetical protein